MLIDYSKIKCPKCGKSYFKVRHTNTVELAVFRCVPEPIYKDGVLQNPQPEEASKSYYSCLECGCTFRVESYSDHFDTIDEDAEHAAEQAAILDKITRLKNTLEKKELENSTKGTAVEGKSITAGTGTITIKQDNTVKYVRDIVYDDTLYYKGEKLSDVIENLQTSVDKIEKFIK